MSNIRAWINFVCNKHSKFNLTWAVLYLYSLLPFCQIRATANICTSSYLSKNSFEVTAEGRLPDVDPLLQLSFRCQRWIYISIFAPLSCKSKLDNHDSMYDYIQNILSNLLFGITMKQTVWRSSVVPKSELFWGKEAVNVKLTTYFKCVGSHITKTFDWKTLHRAIYCNALTC